LGEGIDQGAKMPTSKHPTSYRLSQECLDLLHELAQDSGISATSVIEQAVRHLYRTLLPGGSRASGRLQDERREDREGNGQGRERNGRGEK
jgi:hypothetical protein